MLGFGLLEKISMAVFFKIYWPLLLGLLSLLFAFKISYAVATRKSYEMDSIAAMRFKFLVSVVHLCILISAVCFMAWFEIPQYMFETYQGAKEIVN